MKKFFLTGGLILSLFGYSFAQVGINTDNSAPDNSAILDVKSTSRGILFPRMTVGQRVAISNPATGLMVYQTSAPAGYYYFTGASWTRMVNDQYFYLPVGSVMIWTGNTPPGGWLLCEGQAVSRTAFAGLFSVIDTLYGGGNDSTTFNLPNLKGRMPVGLDLTKSEFDQAGKSGGATTHTITQAEMPAHVHSVNPPSTTSSSGGGSHTHSIDPPLTTSGQDGDHTHENDADYGSGIGSASSGDKVTYNNDGGDSSDECSSAGAHTHTVDIASFSSVSAGTHTHTVNVGAFNSSAAGTGSAVNILSPYLVMHYIIKY